MGLSFNKPIIDKLSQELEQDTFSKYQYFPTYQTKGRNYRVLSLHNDTLMLDIKKEIEKLSPQDLELIQRRAVLAAFTYKTKPNYKLTPQEQIVSELNQKYISFKSEFIVSKYLDEFIHSSSNPNSVSKTSSNYKDYRTLFQEDINEKLNAIPVLKTININELIPLFEKAGTGTNYNDKEYINGIIEKTPESTFEKIERIKEITNKHGYFKSDIADYIFKDGTTLDFKSSNLTTKEISKAGFIYNDKTILSENDILTLEKEGNIDAAQRNLLLTQYHDKLTGMALLNLNIYQNYGLKIKESDKVKDIIVQTFYNTTDEKLYITATTNKQMFEVAENIKIGLVGYEKKIGTLQDLCGANLSPRLFLRYLQENEASDYTKITKEDFIQYNTIRENIIDVLEKATVYNEDLRTINGINQNELVRLNKEVIKLLEIIKKEPLKKENEEYLDYCKMFYNKGNKFHKELNKEIHFIEEETFLKSMREKLGEDISFIIFKETKDKEEIEKALSLIKKLKWKK